MPPVTAAGADMELDARPSISGMSEIGAARVTASARPNRWTVAVAAAVVMLTTGTLYSWAIFTQPLLVAYHWDVMATTAAFAIANFSLATVGAIIGGLWQDKVGPRRVALVGVTLWGTGNLLAGLGTAALGARGFISPMESSGVSA
jgi:MFS family permease